MRFYPFNTRFLPSLASSSQPAALATTVTQRISINCPVAKALDFMSDAQQWLPWAMPGLESVQPLPFGQWLLRTAHSLFKLRPLVGQAQGELAYELINATAGRWLVPLRMAATPTGCQLAVTFSRPECLSQAEFETSMHHTAEGLNILKLVLEQD